MGGLRLGLLGTTLIFVLMAGGISQGQYLFLADSNKIDEISLTTGAVGTFVFANRPFGLAFDSSGNLFYSDANTNSVMAVTQGGQTFTIDSGFSFPSGLAFASNGNLYEVDTFSDTINTIAPSGVVTPLATGLNDPMGRGVAVDSAGNIYQAASDGSGLVNKITPGGTVTPFATLSYGFNVVGMAFDSQGNLYVADGIQIDKITPAGVDTVFANGFSFLQYLAFDHSDNLFVSEQIGGTLGNGVVLEITPGGTITTIASGLLIAEGLAFADIPEPGSLAMLAAALSFLGGLCMVRKHLAA